MVELAKDSDLADGLFLACWFCKLTPIVLFDGNTFTSRFMNALLDNSIGSFTNWLAKMVSIEVRTILRRELLEYVILVHHKTRRADALMVVRSATDVSTSLCPTKMIEPIIEKSKCVLLLLLMLLMLKSLLFLKRLSVFFELSRERVLDSVQIVLLEWLIIQQIDVCGMPAGSMCRLDSCLLLLCSQILLVRVESVKRGLVAIRLHTLIEFGKEVLHGRAM